MFSLLCGIFPPVLMMRMGRQSKKNDTVFVLQTNVIIFAFAPNVKLATKFGESSAPHYWSGRGSNSLSRSGFTMYSQPAFAKVLFAALHLCGKHSFVPAKCKEVPRSQPSRS